MGPAFDPDAPWWVNTLLLLLLVGLIPAAVTWITQRATRREVKKTNETLTTNNGGSHIKDQLDRMERQVNRTETRMILIEREQIAQGVKLDLLTDKQKDGANESATLRKDLEHHIGHEPRSAMPSQPV